MRWDAVCCSLLAFLALVAISKAAAAWGMLSDGQVVYVHTGSCVGTESNPHCLDRGR